MAHNQIADLVAAPHHAADDGVCSVALVLNGLVQRRVEFVALGSESRKAQSLKGSHQFVGDRLQRTGLQIAVAARPVEIVEHRKQLGDDGGLRALGNQLLIAQRPLPVVVVLRFDALQGGLELGDLIRVRSRGDGSSRRRPTWGRAGSVLTNFAGLGIDTPFVGDGHRLVRIV